MKSISGKTAQWIWVTVAMAAAAFAAGQGGDEAARGERIMNNSCLGCHDLRPIQTQAFDAEGWTMKVNAMIEKGAQVSTDDLPILANFLARSYGPLPEGAGKAVLLNRCTVCHDLQRIRRHPSDAEGWEDTLSTMLNEGAMLTDQEFAILVNYLSRNFR